MVANQPWSMASNARNISLELSKHCQVLYVCPPLDRKVLLTKKDDAYVNKVKRVVEKREQGIEMVADNMWVCYPDFVAESINWIPVSSVHDAFNRMNNRKFADCIARATNDLGFDRYIIFNDNVIMRGFYLPEILRPQMYIYYLRDYLVTQPYYKRHGVRLEQALFTKSTMVLANSLFLRDYAAAYNSNAHYVGQGCEIDLFDPDQRAAVPIELRGIKTPIIGYIGYLTSFRLDIQLIEHIAVERKDWTIVLVGPENQAFQSSNLHSLDNVIFAGNKAPEVLPQYLQHFDVCINPQLVNELTIGNYPRKIDEYLAMGKPVVATRTKAMEAFEGYCYLSEGSDEFVRMIGVALKDSSEESRNSRIALARSHSWEQNVADMMAIIEKNAGKELYASDRAKNG